MVSVRRMRSFFPPSQKRNRQRRRPGNGRLYIHPAYPEGFTAGLKDGAEVLMALGRIPLSHNL
jgi:hypothetical protein